MFNLNNFGKSSSEKNESVEVDYSQALIISFDLSEEFGTRKEQELAYNLEDQIFELIDKITGADIDGHEFGDNEFCLYIYGSDVQLIYKKIRPLLDGLPFRPVRVSMRIGEVDDLGAKEIRESII